MSPLDLMIIYLTLAAPFGVYELTQRRKQSFWKALLVFVGWPVFAVRLLASWLSSGARARRQRDEKLASIRFQFERLLPAGDNWRLFEFREEFHRFVGLTESLHLPAIAANSELSKITLHPDPNLAARCQGRRNMAKIKRHQARAAEELSARINGLPSDVDLTAAKSELAAHLQIDGSVLDSGLHTHSPAAKRRAA